MMAGNQMRLSVTFSVPVERSTDWAELLLDLVRATGGDVKVVDARVEGGRLKPDVMYR